MTEIKVDLTEEDLAALRLVLAASERSRNNTPAWHRLRELLDSIEEQVKPAIEEPDLDFSVINARPPYSTTVTTLTRLGGRWVDIDANDVGPFDTLSQVEVLRVGIGETYPHAVGDAVVLGPETIRSADGAVISHKGENYYPPTTGEGTYNRGRRDFANAVRRDLSALRASTPLVVEQRAYDKALATVAALLGES